LSAAALTPTANRESRPARSIGATTLAGRRRDSQGDSKVEREARDFGKGVVKKAQETF